MVGKGENRAKSQSEDSLENNRELDVKSRYPEIEIYSRQGHDPMTSLMHYQSLSFTDYEMMDIEKRLTEWGILRK
jgi:hypothetical protein